ncbi:SDR family oxidoreductase [Pseudoalteromonas sp. T1lg65]|uniref:SDR family oxidoreductase n=1 Tax=Pseudoalteromonas sp. T1lg65 TaxID=2077101 RepID=UPI003F78D58F
MLKKSILITGCSTGIGLHCAKQLQQDGLNVIASVRKTEDMAQFKSLDINCIQLDLDCTESIERGFNDALALANGTLYALFNNGAYGQPGAVEDLPTTALIAQFNTNLFGWHHLTRLAVKHMRKQGTGRIIQNSSVLGLVALPYRGAYNASKFALEGLTDTLRMELRDSGIQVSLIEPGPIKSEFRNNAKSAFLTHIDIETSAHKNEYQSQLERLAKQNTTQPFTLGPEAVYQVLHHALTAKRAKARYYVTFPTYLMGYLKRVLSTNLLDKVLLRNR